MNELKIGDVVRMRSGGPTMTVKHVDPDGAVHVVWFDSEDHLQQAKVKPDTIKR